VSLPEHMSYSQLNSYLTCGEQYRLERVEGIYGRPSWASVGGSTLHAMTEAWDRLQVGDLTKGPQGEILETLDPWADWDRYFEVEILEAERRSGYSRDEFRASGRATKEYPDKEDARWWRAEGPLMVERWIAWRQVSPWEIWFDGDRPAIELEINAAFGPEGEQIMVKAYVDRVMVHSDGTMAVVDLKSGSRTPVGAAQLGQYAESLVRCNVVPVRPQYGFFWDARKGGTTPPVELDQWSGEYFDYAYAGVARRRKAGDLYLPQPGNLCASCGVKDFCRYMGGSRAGEVPAPWE